MQESLLTQKPCASTFGFALILQCNFGMPKLFFEHNVVGKLVSRSLGAAIGAGTRAPVFACHNFANFLFSLYVEASSIAHQKTHQSVGKS